MGTVGLVQRIEASTSYEKFAMTDEDIGAVLNNSLSTDVKKNTTLSADISFVCADIKYDRNCGSFKVCECGDGIYMSFRPAMVSMNKHVQSVVAPYWGVFWNYLSQFNKPIWLVEDKGPHNALALDVFNSIGGRYVKDLHFLGTDSIFRKSCVSKFKKSDSINDYKGIVIYRPRKDRDRDCIEFVQFKKKHPEFLYVNDVIRNVVKRKDNTYNTLHNAGLDEFIPHFAIYPTEYNDKLACDITSSIKSDLLVVKPVFFSLSHGVNVIAKDDLDGLLQLILRDKQKISPGGHRCFAYWRRAKPDHFLVTEYARSHILYKDGKPYDPTMRIVCMMHHDQGKLQVTFLAGFWKIPVHSLEDEKATETERHVTIAHAGDYYTGILLEEQDRKSVETWAQQFFSQFYEYMLGIENK